MESCCLSSISKKAYEKIEWNFFDKALECWRFDWDFRALILGCVSTVRYTFLINGGKAGSLNLQRGLRQRDPLSLIMFVICSKFLSGFS